MFPLIFWQTFLIDSNWMKTKCHEPIKNKFKQNSFEYQNIEEEFKTQPDWPPVSASTNNLAELMRMESVASGLTIDDIDVDAEQKSGKKGGPGGDWELSGNNRVPRDNSEVNNSGVGGSGDSSQPDSPPQTPRDDKTPLLIANEKSEEPASPQDRSVPLLNQVQNTTSSLLRNPSLDTSPLVENEQSQNPLPVNLETTALWQLWCRFVTISSLDFKHIMNIILAILTMCSWHTWRRIDNTVPSTKYIFVRFISVRARLHWASASIQHQHCDDAQWNWKNAVTPNGLVTNFEGTLDSRACLFYKQSDLSCHYGVCLLVDSSCKK